MLAQHKACLLPPAGRPTWSWDFTRGALPAGSTFSRGSAGWYFNSAGLLVQAAANVPRFDCDPVAGVPFGYLAEMQSANSNPHSDDASAWTQNANISVSTDGTLGPDGATQMSKLTATAGSGYHEAKNLGTASASAGSVVGVSAVVKQGTARYVTIGDGNDSVWHVGTFDFQTGTWSAHSATTTIDYARFLGNGLWRIAVKCTASTAHTPNVAVSFGPNASQDSSQSYTAAGTETGYVIHGQIEVGGVGITSIIRTTTGSVTRSGDNLSLPLAAMGWRADHGGMLRASYRLHTQYPATPGFNHMALFASNAGDWQNSVQMHGDWGGTGQPGVYMYSGGAGVGNGVHIGVAPPPFVARTQTVIWRNGRIKSFWDGTDPACAFNGTLALPTAVTRMDFGLYLGAHALGGTLARADYWCLEQADRFAQLASYR